MIATGDGVNGGKPRWQSEKCAWMMPKLVETRPQRLGSGLVKRDPQPDRCEFDHGH